ncbi:MAG: P-loop NTPase fold protein [Candidatus Binatia bacterium]
MATSRPIAQTPAQAYALVIPDEPLPSGDERYVQLDAVRGKQNIARLLANRLSDYERATGVGSPRVYARSLVTGHRGCGKTTELYRLRDLLTAEGFTVVYFDANQEFDLQKQNISWWNILLEMVLQIDDQLSQPPYNLQIPDDLRDEAVEWLARVVTKKTERQDVEASLATDFSIGGALPFFIKAKGAIKSLFQTGSSTVKEIELEVERRPTVLREAVNAIIAQVNTQLKERNQSGLVIIIDGLEKIPLRHLDNGLTTHQTLFVHNANYLQSPQCHLIYTLPLAIFASVKINEFFSERPNLMPMVHVRHANEQEDPDALAALEEVVGRRVSPTLFAPGVIKTLALASGGHMRDFLFLVREAAGEATQSTTITDSHARRAIVGLTDLYNRTIQQAFIEPLDYVAQHRELPGGPQDGELINRLLVLEYRNDETWSALHPCVKSAGRYVKAPRASKEETSSF